MAPKKGTTRPSGNTAKAPNNAAPIKAVQQYSSPIGPKAPSNKVQMMQRAQQMKKENAKTITTKKTKEKAKTGNTNTAIIPLPVVPSDPGPGPGGSDYTPYEFTPTSVKIPDKDAVIALQRDGADQALITSVLFEQIGATELVKFTKNDTIDGINPAYSVISNIADLKTKLDVSYLIAKQRSDTTIDNGFSIRLQDKLPSIDYLFENDIPNYVYFDTTVNSEGSLVIELDNIDIDEIIEVEIDTNGTIVEVRQ
jgi:hypothetical protein